MRSEKNTKPSLFSSSEDEDPIFGKKPISKDAPVLTNSSTAKVQSLSINASELVSTKNTHISSTASSDNKNTCIVKRATPDSDSDGLFSSSSILPKVTRKNKSTVDKLPEQNKINQNKSLTKPLNSSLYYKDNTTAKLSSASPSVGAAPSVKSSLLFDEDDDSDDLFGSGSSVTGKTLYDY